MYSADKNFKVWSKEPFDNETIKEVHRLKKELNNSDFNDIFYKDTSEDDRGGRSADRDAFIDSMSDFYRFNNVSEHKPFKVDMEPVLKEIPIKLTPFSEWISQQDWNEELDTTAG